MTLPRHPHQSPFPQAANRPSIPYLGAPEDEMVAAFTTTYLDLSYFLTGSLVDPYAYKEVEAAVHETGVSLTPRFMSAIRPVVAFYAGYEGQSLSNIIIAQDGWEDMRKAKLKPTVFTPRPNSPTSTTSSPLGPVQRHVQAAEKLTLDLIHSITQSQLAKIRAAIIDSIKRGITVTQTGKRISTLVGLFPRWQIAVENFRAGLERQGLPESVIDKRVAAYHAKLVKARGMMIARTELVRALNAGRLAGWMDMADRGKLNPLLSVKEWVTAPGACDDCLSMLEDDKRTVVGIETEFDTPYGKMEMPPMHPHCFPSGTLVSGPRATGGVTRLWQGKMTTIMFASGNQFSVTPNHPVLTPEGWVAAGLLHEGGSVIRCIPAEGEQSTVYPSDVQVPSVIEEVVASVGEPGEMSARRVPVAPEDFHGDGEGSQVAIVWTDGLLRDGGDLVRVEHGSHGNFSLNEGTPARLNPLRFRLQLSGRLLTSFYGSVTRSRILGILLGSSTGHHESIGGQGIPAGDSATDEEATNNGPTDSTVAGDGEFGFTFTVSTDEIVGVRQNDFSGHVYNLQTVPGWYIANGVVVHNCRCSVNLTMVRPSK